MNYAKKLLAALIGAGLFGIIAAQDIVWDTTTGFAQWAAPNNLKVTRTEKMMQLEITKPDPYIRTAKNLKIDPLHITQIQIEYRAQDLPNKTSGEIYFIGADGTLHGDRCWKIPSLVGDNQWHSILLTEVVGGMEKWTKAGTIRMLRLDPVNCGCGKIEIRAIRLLDRSGYRSIAAGTEGIGYGSSAHQHIWYPGNTSSHLPRIVGKANQFDHRYRFLMRFPTDLVLPDGAVKDAMLYFSINGFYGKALKRTYLVEIIEDDLPKLLPSTLTHPKAHTVLRFEAGVSSSGHTIAVPITEELNKALENLWGSVTFRVRPESEPNTDPGASGMSINHLTVHIDVR